ncbi:antibiotic biosynthesis monooxygenase [Myceligenerans sp. TRM 65318]|uniref:Antibiotic biosynthesis monooxygenase n=2 Tax=Myceligenerans pegani TaxID=2776917 RepID=A0ABR9N4E7_9MICO|nr:antibiotic biosynthesis monooxygenase [Myceligenerans sp. TRM 65318]MBE3020818.1 antibiotic biosynthesis monooxygenase [Myceligenerans sp. TRM 65318]
MRILWVYGSLDTTRTILPGPDDHPPTAPSRIDQEQAGGAGTPVRPIHEVAQIEVRPGHEQAFEEAVAAATPLFQQAGGARTLTLSRSLERPQHYQLTIGWDTVEDHVTGFRESPAFLAWRGLVGDHIAGPPRVEHLRAVHTGF